MAQLQEDGILPGETKDQPKVRQVQVTASVSDNEDPSVPILVAPENNATVTTSTPDFVWKQSTDNFGISKYQLVLDGEILFDSIPTSTADRPDFQLVFSSETGEYILTPTAALADGTHTWKIIAFDLHGNTASSVTWTFTIDTTAPTFLITTIESYQTSISAQDLLTVPSEPFVLSENQPTLSGTGEALSQVSLQVTLPDGTSTYYQFVIDEAGNWTVTLGTLPRDTVIDLDFVITDPAGNVSLLSNVLLILPTSVVIIPPLGPFPGAEIPLIPPREHITQIITRYPTTGTFVSLASTKFATATTTLQLTIRWSDLLVILLLIGLPLLKTILLAWQFGGELSLRVLSRIWRAIGLYSLFSATPQGIVLERSTQSPASFAPIIFSGETNGKKPIREVTLTNAQGIYARLDLPEGSYRASVSDDNCLFPTPVPAPTHLNWRQHYVGLGFSITPDQPEPILIIPVEDTKKEISLTMRIKYAVLHSPMLSLVLAAAMLVCSFIFPSVVNFVVSAGYLLLYLYITWRDRKVGLEGILINSRKEPIHLAVVVLESSKLKWCYWIAQSDVNGLYRLLNTAVDADQLEVVSQSYCMPQAHRTQNLVMITPEVRRAGYLDIALTTAAESSCPL